ncbi:MAG: heme-copper oxidase subunit III [Planctomycetaceae bacterium]|nr:heme-copper oxidase subunit III [Planctomycetaceae bacterium]
MNAGSLANRSERRRAAAEFGLGAHDAPRIGMLAFLCSEAAFFATLIIAYLTYLGQADVGPTPGEILSLGLAGANTVVLLSSSVTLWWASQAMTAGRTRSACSGLIVTILLGSLFLAGTAYEWRELIDARGLTISTNLFGTTYYTLVGCHAFHVTLGVLAMLVLAGLLASRALSAGASRGFELVEWYWHFVDGVWIAVFLVVYVWGR